MSNFPGEDSDIPKRLLESLEGQPLNYLIPKCGLSELVDPLGGLSIPIHKEAFPPPSAATVDESLRHMNTGIVNPKKRNHVFRRPHDWKNTTRDESRSTLNMLEGLSPLAKQCLMTSNIELNSENIQEDSNNLPENIGKHSLETNNSPGKTLNVESPTKKMKVGSHVTVNLASLAQRYLGDFMEFLNEIEKDELNGCRNVEYWMTLPNKHYVLTQDCLTRLQMAMNNILSMRGSMGPIDVGRLVKLLDLLVNNLKTAQSQIKENWENQVLNGIAHTSVSLIFTIFLLEGNEDKRMSLERYILMPVEFIADSVKKVKKALTDPIVLKIELGLLHQSISLLPSYIYHRPFLDKGLTTKLICIFTDLLMDNELDSVTNTLALQYGRDNVKLECMKILVSLFTKVPDQREFIIEELLSNVERVPVKRIQKRLRKLENDVFVTDFTMTIILLLETLSTHDFAKKIAISQPDLIPTTIEQYTDDTKTFTNFANQIGTSIFQLFVRSTSNYRHVLENYVQDLIILLPFPQWCVSQDLLYFITRKLLSVFDPSHPQPANVESTCLHLLGSIGLAMFEVKCHTSSEDANNLVKLFNSPSSLSILLKHFDTCSAFTKEVQRKPAGKYLWHKKFGILVQLDEYADNTEDSSNVKSKLSMQELKNLGEENIQLKKNTKNEDASVIKRSYFSILHALDLLNLYDPYLKLILSILGKNKVKLKSVAIKCLSLLATADRRILNSPMVKSTIGKTLLDPSASVKDAVLDLISIESSYLEYYQQLNVNYDDDSILIRKHVLKINGNIYDETNSLEIKVFVASRILLKIEDEEDNIIEIARKLLLKKWIFSIKADDPLEQKTVICNNILFVMSNVAMLNDKCSQLFEWYLNFFLLNEQLHSPDDYQFILRSLNKLTDYLVQGIVELQSNEPTEKNTLLKQKLLVLLSKFSDCSSVFITKDHIISLYPYIVSDERSNLQFYILHVFKNTMQNLSNFKPKFLFDLETTLLSRLPRMSVREIGEAMPLIWCVASNRKDISRVTKACSSCFQHMGPYINIANKNPREITVESKLQRLIYLSAAFARFCKFPNNESKPSYIQGNDPVHEYVAKCLLLLSRQGVPHVMRRISIKALTQLCGDYPKLFNSKHILNLLDEEFESDRLDIKLVILESLYDFFIEEERKSIEQTGFNVSVSSNSIPKKQKEKEFISGDGICAALVTRFLKHILKICLSYDIKSSLVAVRSLKLILQYGYTNPSHCIPTVIALISSTNQYLHNIAIEILHEIFEKYETMVFASISQGIKLAIDYCRSLQGSEFYKHDSFLIALQTILANNKKNTTKFFKGVTRALKIYFNQIVGASCDLETRDDILFLINNLPLLKFPTQYELLSLLKVIELQSNQIKEAVVDEFTVSKNVEKVKNSIITELSLFELKNLFIHLYNLKSDVINELEDSLAKNKPLPTIAFRSHLGERISLIIKQCEKEDVIHRYLHSLN